MPDTHCRYFRLDRHDLVYLKFILEAHEGLATLSTIDRERVIVRVCYPHFFSADVNALLHALGKEIDMTEVPEPADVYGPVQAASCGNEAGHAG